PTSLIALYVLPGSDGVNKNYGLTNVPLRTWHVIGHSNLSFASQPIIETCTYSPKDVDQHLAYWVQDQESPTDTCKQPTFRLTTYLGQPAVRVILAFTALREIGPVPILAAQMVPSGVQLTWPDLGGGYGYTLERLDTIAATNWTPVPSGFWPTTA